MSFDSVSVGIRVAAVVSTYIGDRNLSNLEDSYPNDASTS